MVRKTTKTVRKSVKSSAKKAVYKVTASYTVKFRTASEAKAAVSKIKANSRAIVGSVKKSGNFFALPVKFVYYVADAKNKTAAVKAAQAHGARVSVSTVKR